MEAPGTPFRGWRLPRHELALLGAIVLVYVGTGNAEPWVQKFRGAQNLDNLYTCSIVALNADTGKMVWYYQTSPHDTHDFDSSQTPILVDGDFNGRPRKLVLTAARNGYFFVVDRLTGEHLRTMKYSDTTNWAKGINEKGQPVGDPTNPAWRFTLMTGLIPALPIALLLPFVPESSVWRRRVRRWRRSSNAISTRSAHRPRCFPAAHASFSRNGTTR